MESRKELEKINNFLSSSKKKIVLMSHTHPDGDALGSGMALKLFLNKLGHEVDFILPDRFPEFLDWMPNTKDIIIYDEDRDKAISALESADCMICVDMNNIGRLNGLSEQAEFFFNKKTSILFDHHINPNENFNFFYWDINVSSTSELIYDFFQKIGKLDLIDHNIAECLYVGIITDTGSFSYSCNNPETYIIVSNLIRIGVDGAKIHQYVYSTFTESRIRLFGVSLFEKLVIDKKHGGAYIALSAEDLNNHNYQVGDTEGLVNYTLSIKGIVFGALLTEMENFIKISFRSEGDINVNLIAKEFFNGGGHKNAAGANFYGKLEDACIIIENIIKSRLA